MDYLLPVPSSEPVLEDDEEELGESEGLDPEPGLSSGLVVVSTFFELSVVVSTCESSEWESLCLEE